jgi:hypothetical protein
MTSEAHLSVEQRRALALLLNAPRGLTEVTLMRVHDLAPELLTSLVRAGLAEVVAGTVRAGGRMRQVDRVRITNAGRQAIKGDTDRILAFPIGDRIVGAQAAILIVALCTYFLAALFAERRQHVRMLKEGQALLQEALAAGAVMAFECNPAGGLVKRSENAAQVLGFDPHVWSGRASQEVSSICRLCGLASMYPASDWSVLCSGPPWISARLRSH